MFWDNFIFYCNKKGVAPNAAASDVGVKSSGTVTGWKNGAVPRQRVLKRLADYFGVSVSDLTDGQKETAPQEESGFQPTREYWERAACKMSKDEIRMAMDILMKKYVED